MSAPARGPACAGHIAGSGTPDDAVGNGQYTRRRLRTIADVLHRVLDSFSTAVRRLHTDARDLFSAICVLPRKPAPGVQSAAPRRWYIRRPPGPTGPFIPPPRNPTR